MQRSGRSALIVALGNPLVGQDGFGASVLQALVHDDEVPTLADLVDAHTDLLGQIDRFRDYPLVVLIDAVLGASPVGAVSLFEEADLARWPDASPGVHQISPLLAVRLFRTLHPKAETTCVVLVGLGVDRVERGAEGVEPRAVSAAVHMVRRLVGVPPATQAQGPRIG
jgi:hydrogenase maturation protease